MILNKKHILLACTAAMISTPAFLFSSEARADIKLTVGKPERDGNFTVGIQPPKPTKIITIPIEKSDTPEKKAEKIEKAIEAEINIDIQRDGNMLTFPKTVKKVSLADSTGQDQSLETAEGQKPKKAKLDGTLINPLQPTLSGLDDNGNESIFRASLGFKTALDNIFISSELLFSELGGDSIDDWLSATFTDLQQQLPTIYQSHLSLNLSDDEISFDFPSNTLPNSGFVRNQATDTNGGTSLEIEVDVPEPSSILSLLALGTLGAASTLKRKLKPSKSTEKETTKVG
ncbi:PEP-CTERM sorting domain-containing protein [Microcystis aeruginosa]|uniref:PEP-CTERM sorting domain-containing protein n=1 Tax=Microcystis aeruginosa TaxID=1126 RepID=UPI0021AB76AF|nr:PEP-CTERM sorting domain-containing protein [Microcystis aeruginosa]